MTKNDITICYSFFGDKIEKNIFCNIYIANRSFRIKLFIFKK